MNHEPQQFLATKVKIELTLASGETLTFDGEGPMQVDWLLDQETQQEELRVDDSPKYIFNIPLGWLLEMKLDNVMGFDMKLEGGPDGKASRWYVPKQNPPIFPGL